MARLSRVAAQASALASFFAASVGFAQGVLPSFTVGPGVLPTLPTIDTSSGAAPAGLTFLPGIRTLGGYTTNVDRSPSGQAQGAFVAEVSPLLQATANTANLQGFANLAIRNFVKSAGDDKWDPLRWNLTAGGNARLAGDWLGMRAYAWVGDINTSAFGAVGFDPSWSNVNRSQFANATINPYIVGRLGSTANYGLQYAATTSYLENCSNCVAKLDQVVSGSLASAPEFGRWGWSAVAYYQNRQFDGGVSRDRTLGTGSVFYRFSPELLAGLNVNYDDIQQVYVDGKNSGWGPGAFLEWRPSQFTFVRGRIDDRYYGTTGALTATQTVGRFGLSAGYVKGISTSGYASVLGYPATPVGPLGATGDTGLPGGAALPGSGQVPSSGIVPGTSGAAGPPIQIYNEGATAYKSFNAAVNYAYARGNINASVYWYDSASIYSVVAPGGGVSGIAPSTAGKSLGGNLLGTYSITDRTQFWAMGRVSTNESSTNNLKSRLWSVTASFLTQFAPRTTGSIGIGYTAQDAMNSGAAEYDSFWIYGGVQAYF